MSKDHPTPAEMRQHYADALDIINSQRIQIEGLRSAILIYLRDLRSAAGDFEREVYIGKEERALLDSTIAALESNAQPVHNPAKAGG